VRPYCVQITPGLCVVAVFFNDTLNTYVYQEQLIKGPNINTSWRHTLSVYFPPAERQNGWLHLMCFKSHVIYYISNANIKHPERAFLILKVFYKLSWKAFTKVLRAPLYLSSFWLTLCALQMVSSCYPYFPDYKYLCSWFNAVILRSQRD
jgi:hypothetical protein